MGKHRHLELAVLAAVPFVMVLGNSMLIPVFPRLKEALDITQFQVGLLITAFSFPAAVLIPFAGAVSDQVGRKPVMAPALVLYGFGGLVAGVAAVLMSDPYPVVLAGRVLQGLGAGGTYQLAMALCGDIFTGSERPKVLGLLEAANGLGKVVSPLLGAAVAMIVWFAPFFTYGVLALPVAAAVWLMVKEPELKGAGRSIGEYWHDVKSVVKQKGAALFASYLTGMTVLFLLFGVLSFVSDELASRFHVNGFAAGLWLAAPVTAMAVTAYVIGVVLESRLPWLKPGALVGIGLAAVSLAAAPAVMNTLPLFIAVIALLGIGIGMVLPCLNMLITSAADRRERGVVTALYGTVRFVGVAVGPPAFALAVSGGRNMMFWGAAALAAVVFALAWWLIDPGRLLAGEGGTSEGQAEERQGAGLRRGHRRRPEPVPHN